MTFKGQSINVFNVVVAVVTVMILVVSLITGWISRESAATLDRTQEAQEQFQLRLEAHIQEASKKELTRNTEWDESQKKDREFREKTLTAMTQTAETLIHLRVQVQSNTKEHASRYNTNTIDEKFKTLNAADVALLKAIDEVKEIQRRNEDWMVKMDNRQDTLDVKVSILEAGNP